MKCWLALILFAALPGAAIGPPRLGATLKFGVHYTGWFQAIGGRESARDRSNSWALGPALEFRLTNRVAMEAGVVYRQIGRDAGGGYSFYPFSDRERGYAWEFPVVGKYRLPFRLNGLAPFVAAGALFDLANKQGCPAVIPD